MLFKNKKQGGLNMENVTESKKPSLKQLLALASFIAGVLEEIYSAKQIQYYLQNKSHLRHRLFETFTSEFVEIRKDWEKFYKDEFEKEIDFREVIIPPKPKGNYRLLFIAKGLTPSVVFMVWKFKKASYVYGKTIDSKIASGRCAVESYAIWAKDTREPDANFLGKSVNETDPNMRNGITLLERMILESKFFAETGEHLDINGITMCSGTKDNDGNIPSVYTDTLGMVAIGCDSKNTSAKNRGIRYVIA